MQPEFKLVETNGIKLRAALQGQGPLVVMVHGFPESWYSWRHQMQPIADAGFTACAIDVRGYGGSDKPHPVEAYEMKHITADIAGLVDALSPGKPGVLIGHDWGAPLVWHTAYLYPQTIRAVAALSVPWWGQPQKPLSAEHVDHPSKQGKFFYITYFQPEGQAEADFERDPRDALRRFYFALCGEATGEWRKERPASAKLFDGLPNPERFPAWMSEADLDYFVGEFERSGFRGPINKYRTFVEDHAFMDGRGDYTIRQPSFFIAGDKDGGWKMPVGVDTIARMRANTSDLRGVHILPGVGHWTQQEAPEETNRLLIGWLKGL
ncbi:MAG: alpha/beta fold hydrolase [Hyphomonadaceae bacterium]